MPRWRYIPSVILAALGCAAAAVAARQSWDLGSSLGVSASGKELMAAQTILVDVFAVALPAMAVLLGRSGRRAWGTWIFAAMFLTVAVATHIGFAANERVAQRTQDWLLLATPAAAVLIMAPAVAFVLAASSWPRAC